MYTLEQLQKKSLKELKEIGGQLNVLPTDDRRCRENWVNAIAGVNPPLLQLLETSPAEDVQAQESPIIETVEASPAEEVEQAQELPIESKFGRIVYPRPAQKANENKTDKTDTDRVGALARWDAENAEMLAVSMDSMCEWAPCPEEWYEPKGEILPLKASSMIELPKQSEVMELSITGGSSSTSDFFIPTFGSWGDRPDRSTDEPPDAGTFAYLPKPKPPNFPPQASWTQFGHKLDTSQPKSAQVRLSQASRNYPETIPKLFPRVAAGSSTQPARSPPGGDA